MFTGIVQALLPMSQVLEKGNLKQFCLDLGSLGDGLQLGASVAVNGTCLTVTRIDPDGVWFDVIAETLRVTNLGAVVQGTLVDVERSFQIGDEVGGHIVSGHVTGTAQLLRRVVNGNDHVMTFALDGLWMKYVFHKGFIALDGASLTVSSVDRMAHTFCVSLIPETLTRTTLGQMSIGDRVNVEVDGQTLTVVDTVERLFADPQWRSQLQSEASRSS